MRITNEHTSSRDDMIRHDTIRYTAKIYILEGISIYTHILKAPRNFKDFTIIERKRHHSMEKI